MKTLAEKLVARQLATLEPYQSARRIGGSGQVYLNANELPYAAYSMPAGETWQRYPDFLPMELANKYADYLDIEHSTALAVRGADEGIDLLIRAFCEPGKDFIRVQSPTYSMYEFIARAHQVNVEAISLDDNCGIALEQNCSSLERLKLIFICNPNNPTGNLLDNDHILTIADAHKQDALVVVDEAYSEFCPDASLANMLEQYPNLVILRTLSKAFGLAAVRLGFVIADQSVLNTLNTLIAPYPIPDPSARIGLDALSTEGLAFMRQQRDRIIGLRKRYLELFQTIPVVKKVYPSDGNFLLVKFQNSQSVFNLLSRRGIILRDQNNLPGLENHLRISIGSESEMSQLYQSLQEL